VPRANEKEALACVEKSSAGLHDGSGHGYALTPFRLNNFSLMRNGRVLTLKEHGREARYECRVIYGDQNLLGCVSQASMIVLDLDNLTFSRSNLYGYVDGSTDSLSVAYGDCQRS
jgi:hypothetical protein